MRRTAAYTVLGIIAAAALLAGCSADTRYRALSFFFDGVPAPDAAEKQQKGAALKGRHSSAAQQGAKRYGEHGPYAAKLCEGCHLRGGSFKLLMPVEELCFQCHNIRIDRKTVHGPLASGGCRVCHEPHGSSYRFLLTSESSVFCVRCHNAADVEQRAVHQDNPAECVECHNAHASDQPFLLK